MRWPDSILDKFLLDSEQILIIVCIRASRPWRLAAAVDGRTSSVDDIGCFWCAIL